MTPSPLVTRFRAVAAERPDALALEDDEEQVTFGELLARSERMAAALEDHLEPGGTVLLYAPPSARWVSAFFGAVLARGAVVPLATSYPRSELQWLARDCGARVSLLGGPPTDGFVPLADGKRVRPLDAEEEPRPLLVASERDAAVVLYTSGTTGKPKGARISHGALATQARLVGEAWGVGPGDVLLHALPLHHLHGLCIALITTVLAGGAVRLLPRFDAERVWTEIASGDVTTWMAVPTMYQKLFEALDRSPDRERWVAGAQALRLATSGSAALPKVLAERWREITGSIPLERYGMTEIGVGTTNPLEPQRRRAGTVGMPLPTVELRITHEDRSDAGDGPGELWVRGPSLFSGYLDRDAETAAAFDGEWFQTGDVAVREEGYVRLLGRTSVDILKSGGYKLSALEIEEVLREHPAVLEVAVVGLPDATWGERVVAVVVAREGRGAELATEAVREWAKERLAPYKIPREVRVVAALPRNALGKVQKREVAKLLA